MRTDRRGMGKDSPTVRERAGAGPPWAELVEAVPAAFYVDRRDGTSVWVSSRIEAITGLTGAEWASGYERWLERVHPEDRDRAVASNRRFLESDGDPWSDDTGSSCRTAVCAGSTIERCFWRMRIPESCWCTACWST
jgi:PAS domain-containing protein